MYKKMKSILLFQVIILIAITMADENYPRPNILITHSEVPAKGVDVLKQKCNVTFVEGLPKPTRKAILSKVKGMDGILWATHEALNAEVLDAAGPQLKSISVMSAGLDYVDIPEVKRRNIPLGYTPTVLNNAVADLAIGLMIAATRRFHEGRLKIENNEWEIRPQFLLGKDIKSSTIGIVGFGRIGQTIGKRLQGFDIGDLLYTGHKPKPEAEKFNAKFVTLDELLKQSDIIFMSAPLTTETKNMFNATTFGKMKSSAVFINIARGAVVDQKALIDVLKNNKIFAAGIDVMIPEPLPSDHPLLQLPNLIILPHLGSATERTRDDMSEIAAFNVLQGIAGETMFAPVP